MAAPAANKQAVETLLAIGDGMFSKRRPLMGTWQELADHFYPERGQFTRHYQEGQNFADWLYDSTPALFRRDLGNNLSSYLRPADSLWFRVRTGDKDIDEKSENLKWLDMATHRMRKAYYYAKSGTVDATKQCDHDFVTFGNGVLTVNPRHAGYLSVRNHHLKDVVWLENEDGEVDHVQHKWHMAGRDIARRWPGTMPAYIERGNKKDPTKEYELRRMCCPAEEYYGPVAKGGKTPLAPFIELWVDITSKTLLAETPLAEMIYVIPRWFKMSGSQYGVSGAALIALPDARMIQDMMRSIIEAAEKANDPPLVATADVVQGGVNIEAGGITWVDAEYDEKLGAALRALELGKNPTIGIEVIRDVRERLADGWFINKLGLPDEKEMTAFEAGQRIKQYAREAMPVFEPFGASYSSPLLDLMFRQSLRRGVFGPTSDIPSDLRGRDILFDFDTPVDEIEGRTNVYAFGEVANITQAASQVKQDIARNLDVDKAYRSAIRGTGAPADWLVDEQVVAAQDAEAQANPQPGPGDLSNMAELVKSGAGATGAVAKAAVAAKQAEGVTL